MSTPCGPVAKLFRARVVTELRSAEPAFAQLPVETQPSEIPISNHKLGRNAFSRSSHTGREKFATGPAARRNRVRHREVTMTFRVRGALGNRGAGLLSPRSVYRNRKLSAVS